jgi:hypothetical protein
MRSLISCYCHFEFITHHSPEKGIRCDEEKQIYQKYVEQEKVKELVILLPHAIVDPRTVVVELVNTRLAHTAVVGSGRTDPLAF